MLTDKPTARPALDFSAALGAAGAAAPGLIWGLDFAPDGSHEPAPCGPAPEGRFRWLHLNLADHGTRAWIEQSALFPVAARELLLSSDSHQRALVESGAVCCILHDFERDFDVRATARVGALRVAILGGLIVTARRHPLGAADIVMQRVGGGARVTGAAAALDLLVGALAQNIDMVIRNLSADMQAAEDAFLEGHHPPTSRNLLDIRRRLAQIHRMLDGAQRVFRRLEQDDELPETLQPTVEKLSQRLQGLDADALAVQGQLRLLRDELDLQQDQRTNQNLYLLSVMTALMLPATLVTGLFGMNTGGLPFSGAHGTLVATGIAAGTALATYLFLRSKGFFR
ncbi:Phosphate/sulfate permease [Novosphingobium resinovorum]|uniref:Phosphate/sulfate permease n=1 Tax=Novosphingobium resinovorum TaxID=158500 RepID=A0A031K441_9SPHN|nr:CorA family divalent cation transporter [Novosphingobium resinovorum]EZP83778.1 Phosphate/sulfate permease [Novosphingobium resinovorum]